MTIPADDLHAQWGIGASFEIRDREPENGFGLRVEREILSTVPVADVSLRAHFSYFSQRVDSYRNFGVPAELDSYDYGLAALAGLNLGFLSPYAGLGLGNENFEGVIETVGGQSLSESGLYWNLFAGTSFTMIPVVKPFVEYRFTRLFSQEQFMRRQNGRFAFGVTLEF